MGFEIRGLTEIVGAFNNLDGSMDGTIRKMLNAQGDIVVNAQKKTARSMLSGPYNEEAVANAVTKGRARKSAKGFALPITFEGEQHKSRLAEIAFVNEFGKINQPARPFIRTANEQCADEAANAAANILDKHLQSNGL